MHAIFKQLTFSDYLFCRLLAIQLYMQYGKFTRQLPKSRTQYYINIRYLVRIDKAVFNIRNRLYNVIENKYWELQLSHAYK